MEGAAGEDGRGESIWDRLAATPGRIEDGSTPREACDHYRRWREDLALMKDLGLKAYRFSIAWPRVMPAGTGAVNRAGLDFYSRLVDGLLAAGIAPMATLYHWDLPQALQKRGGWASRPTAEAFGAYARVCARELGGRVKHWCTVNEPQMVAFCGHLAGTHAPGLADRMTALRVTATLNLAHGLALRELREAAPGARVGIVLNLAPVHPASPSEADAAAAGRADGLVNRWFLDPVLRGHYPEDLCSKLGMFAPRPSRSDAALFGAPLDFVGVNYYTRLLVRHAKGGELFDAERAEPPAGAERTATGWEVWPQGLGEVLLRLKREYGDPEVVVTENGAAYDDEPDAAGYVDDDRRVAYLRAHLAEARRAIDDGVRLGGYMAWSLLDNFEWAEGYTRRFGLVRVDYPTQKRTVKASGRWYAGAIRNNGAEI